MKNITVLAIPKLIIASLILSILLTWPINAQSISLSKREESPLLVMLHFDDGYQGIYTNAFPLMEKYGYVGTMFLPTNLIDRPKHMTLDQIKLMKDAGWEIGSHSRTHPDLRKLDQATLYDEVVGSRNVLIGDGLLTLDNAFFCSPMTVWDQYVALLVSQNYKAARAKELIIFDSPIQPEQHVQVVLKDTLIVDIKHWIKQARADNSWLILVFHEIAEGDNEYFCPPDQFEQILHLLQESNVKVTTIEKAITEWENFTSQSSLNDK